MGFFQFIESEKDRLELLYARLRKQENDLEALKVKQNASLETRFDLFKKNFLAELDDKKQTFIQREKNFEENIKLNEQNMNAYKNLQ